MHTPVNTSFIMRLVIASFRLISLATMRRHRRRQVPAALESWHVDISFSLARFIFFLLLSLSPVLLLSFQLTRYFLIRHSKWRSMTTRHTSRKGSLSLPRLSPPSLFLSLFFSPSSFFLFIFLRRSPQPRNFSQVHTLHAAIYVSFAFHVAGSVAPFLFLHASFSTSLSSIIFFRLPSSFCEREEKKSFVAWVTIEGGGGGRRGGGRRRGRVKRARFIYFPEFCRIPPFNRVWSGTWKSARYVAQAVARLKKKNLGKKNAARTWSRRACALYECVIRRILFASFVRN